MLVPSQLFFRHHIQILLLMAQDPVADLFDRRITPVPCPRYHRENQTVCPFGLSPRILRPPLLHIGLRVFAFDVPIVTITHFSRSRKSFGLQNRERDDEQVLVGEPSRGCRRFRD